MLTNLIAGDHLKKASAFVLGGFTDCDPGPDRMRVDQVLRERLGTLRVPIVAGLPAGHGPRNDPLILGRRAEVDADRRAFRLV
jgi:muramoyltetrapeptide carboxypeptidase